MGVGKFLAHTHDSEVKDSSVMGMNRQHRSIIGNLMKLE